MPTGCFAIALLLSCANAAVINAIAAAKATTCAAAYVKAWQQFDPCGLLQKLIEV